MHGSGRHAVAVGEYGGPGGRALHAAATGDEIDHPAGLRGRRDGGRQRRGRDAGGDLLLRRRPRSAFAPLPRRRHAPPLAPCRGVPVPVESGPAVGGGGEATWQRTTGAGAAARSVRRGRTMSGASEGIFRVSEVGGDPKIGGCLNRHRGS